MASKTSAGAATASVADSHETVEAETRGIEKSPAAVLARFSGLVKPRCVVMSLPGLFDAGRIGLHSNPGA
jgi:hypothetical protein